MEPGLYETATYRARSSNFPNGCHVCEVEIDPETGSTQVIGYWVVDDVGTGHPMLVKGQIMGGIAQGLGQVLMEDKSYDEAGQVLTGSFMDYAMPRADNFCTVVIEDNPVPTPTNPLGVATYDFKRSSGLRRLCTGFDEKHALPDHPFLSVRDRGLVGAHLYPRWHA
jgi:carbon-monoxide dehydrogenase large subunit